MDEKNTIRGYLYQDFKVFHLCDQKEIEIDYHHHEFNKIIIFLSGNVTYYVEGKSYVLKPWDILFIGYNQLHKPVIDASKPYERIVIWFHADAMGKFNSEESNLLTCFEKSMEEEYHLLRLTYGSVDEVQGILEQLKQAAKRDAFGSDILEQALLLQLMILFNRLFLKVRNSEQSPSSFDERTQQVLHYINHHIDEDLSLETLATKFYVSKYYLTRKFKEQTGASIHHYILQKRLILAQSLIKKNDSMMDVCLQCGFKDYSNFVRAFKKKFGMSPKNYYKQYKESLKGEMTDSFVSLEDSI